ncbi:hypothetical protein [Pseudoclavibacter sp. VKM Ac-2867]|uniref:hypothetical protein n=1 Tax=Pseudoclavibacter sp. VKM Ac-2867 TaxID=2783829 RepID=UPI00188B28E2|nr:hypothetical protein [Pseudoclavibacter sp. VKM Ac-2867]MBF4458357.1 hypothetical protein [Pseudoclavibacter sp. VKM Ac-2867]
MKRLPPVRIDVRPTYVTEHPTTVLALTQNHLRLEIELTRARAFADAIHDLLDARENRTRLE